MQKILDVVSGVLGSRVDEDAVRKDFPQWDSLKMLQIIMALDEEGFSVPIEKIAEINSVRDILDICK